MGHLGGVPSSTDPSTARESAARANGLPRLHPFSLKTSTVTVFPFNKRRIGPDRKVPLYPTVLITLPVPISRETGAMRNVTLALSESAAWAVCATIGISPLEANP